jgi:chromosome segregation ATPase
MTKSRKQSDSRIEYSPMEPSDIADAVAVLRKENDRANELCAKADLVIKRQEYELSRLRQSSEFLEFSNSKLIEKIKSLETKLRDRTLTLNNNSARLVHTERQLKVEQAKYEAMENELLESRLANRKSQYADLYHGK